MRVKHQGSLAVTQTNRVRRERPPERAVADRTGGPLAQALRHSEACGPVAAFGPRVRGFQGPLRVASGYCAYTCVRRMHIAQQSLSFEHRDATVS